MSDAPTQRFTVSHLDEKDFHSGGLRPYSAYRDLGIAAATGGLATAHVIRMTKPCDEGARGWHRHDCDFQLVYVLKGWFRNEFEGHGAQTMREGSCWIQPPGIRHAVLDYSEDCELLEIVLPAGFATVAG